MKKSFLVLSALLTLVVSGICLQSCSSELDEYTTEEYGYYTEEEIDFINEYARQIGVNITANPQYYGVKVDKETIKRDLLELASLIGEYKMTPGIHQDNNETFFVSEKVKNYVNRSVTRASENVPRKGEWTTSDNRSLNNFTINMSISWDISATSYSSRLSGSVTLDYSSYSGYTINGVGGGSLTCVFAGANSIHFGGRIRSGATSNYIYNFEIVGGDLNMITKTGTYDIVSY